MNARGPAFPTCSPRSVGGPYLSGLPAALVALVFSACVAPPEESPVRLSAWVKGIAVTSPAQEDMTLYIWFYEWNLFDAMRPGENTRGTWKNEVKISQDQKTGTMVSDSPGLSLKVSAGVESADLTLSMNNQSDHNWPPLAAIIPCYSPGPKAVRNPQFTNQKTFFLGAEGLEPLVARELHYNHELRPAVDHVAHQWEESLDPNSRPSDRFPWSFRWPDSAVDARGGLIVRESTDGKWVTGIAWERFLLAQAHNPWDCMHLSIHLGPLEKGESREVRGKIYLFQGTKEELLERYLSDFQE